MSEVKVESQPNLNPKNNLFLIDTLRVLSMFAILAIAIFIESAQPEFLNPQVWVPIYTLLSISFLINAIYIFNYEKLSQLKVSNAVLFAVDQLLVTLVIYYTGLNQSIFLFLYLEYNSMWISL